MVDHLLRFGGRKAHPVEGRAGLEVGESCDMPVKRKANVPIRVIVSDRAIVMTSSTTATMVCRESRECPSSIDPFDAVRVRGGGKYGHGANASQERSSVYGLRSTGTASSVSGGRPGPKTEDCRPVSSSSANRWT